MRFGARCLDFRERARFVFVREMEGRVVEQEAGLGAEGITVVVTGKDGFIRDNCRLVKGPAGFGGPLSPGLSGGPGEHRLELSADEVGDVDWGAGVLFFRCRASKNMGQSV